MPIDSTEQIEKVEQETPPIESVDTGVKNSAEPKDVAPNVPSEWVDIAKKIQNGGEKTILGRRSFGDALQAEMSDLAEVLLGIKDAWDADK